MFSLEVSSSLPGVNFLFTTSKIVSIVPLDSVMSEVFVRNTFRRGTGLGGSWVIFCTDVEATSDPLVVTSLNESSSYSTPLIVISSQSLESLTSAIASYSVHIDQKKSRGVPDCHHQDQFEDIFIRWRPVFQNFTM